MNLWPALFAAFFLLGMIGSALAMAHCGPLETVREKLLQKYGEVQSHIFSPWSHGGD